MTQGVTRWSDAGVTRGVTRGSDAGCCCSRPGVAAAAAADPGAVYTRSLNSLLLATAGGGEGLRRKRKAIVIQPTLGPLQLSALVAAANRSKEKRIGNESMPTIIINNTIHLFLNLDFSIFVIS